MLRYLASTLLKKVAALHEQAELTTATDNSPEPDSSASIAAPTVEYDRSTLEMVMHLETAAEAIRDLQITVSLWPEDCATVDEHTQRIANAMGQAYAARDRFLAFHAFLSGLPAVDPS
ncbi:hypothetical protein P7D22_00005 [Lichenihabitans sp. Uapishka_5]|uniref:hypothetical protein n=1 Tax=Lichenihabitans sp. Uapishka_5 TaxID=3037302 RepID=UPI0029E7E9A5|nr:hypothetical protein [Lichenihabitans sp. Uapishka_5]MDX7949562.1 hypothetical protein [Lichenihabitans sp. Uapishka_5]